MKLSINQGMIVYVTSDKMYYKYLNSDMLKVVNNCMLGKVYVHVCDIVF